jgi:ACR3 family arsenite efflux pump ArsB
MLACPLLFIGLVYGEWLLSWWLLGRRPEVSTDDPQGIIGAGWIYPIAMLMLLGMAPCSAAVLIFNGAHIYISKLSAVRSAIRLLTILVVWLGVYLWLQNDPGHVMEWWID